MSLRTRLDYFWLLFISLESKFVVVVAVVVVVVLLLEARKLFFFVAFDKKENFRRSTTIASITRCSGN
jgi:hypothetical protein